MLPFAFIHISYIYYINSRQLRILFKRKYINQYNFLIYTSIDLYGTTYSFDWRYYSTQGLALSETKGLFFPTYFQFSSIQFSFGQYFYSHISLFILVQFNSIQFSCFMPKRTGPSLNGPIVSNLAFSNDLIFLVKLLFTKLKLRRLIWIAFVMLQVLK